MKYQKDFVELMQAYHIYRQHKFTKLFYLYKHAFSTYRLFAWRAEFFGIPRFIAHLISGKYEKLYQETWKEISKYVICN